MEIKWIKCRPMRQLQPETGESLVIFFKTLIQLYFVCLFIYSLTCCIKEVVKGKIFLRSNEKSVGLWCSYGPKQGNPLQFFSKHESKCFFSLYSFTYCIKEGIKGDIFGDKMKKSVGLWGRGIHRKILKSLINLYSFCLLIYCSA